MSPPGRTRKSFLLYSIRGQAGVFARSLCWRIGRNSVAGDDKKHKSNDDQHHDKEEENITEGRANWSGIWFRGRLIGHWATPICPSTRRFGHPVPLMSGEDYRKFSNAYSAALDFELDHKCDY